MDGDRRVQWGRRVDARIDDEGNTRINIPCRHCVGCNVAQQREWSIRAYHEAQLHTTWWSDPKNGIAAMVPNNACVTLTYDDEHMPRNEKGHGILVKEDFQKFIRRLRRYRERKLNNYAPVSYLMTGEYGQKKPDGTPGRPHFHAIIFNHDFADTYLEQAGNDTHTMSEELDFLWSSSTAQYKHPSKNGRATAEPFTFAAAAYVAGYVAKKAIADGSHDGPVEWHTDDDGVRTVRPTHPEYRQASLKPAIAKEWIRRPENYRKIYEEDCVRIGEWQYHPPRYYDKQLEEVAPRLFGDIKLNRIDGTSKAAEEWSPTRCSSAEILALERLQRMRLSL